MSASSRFNIGEAAARSGVTAKLVRHYESLGLLQAVERTEAGYRQYSDKAVHTLRFIKRARGVGLSMAQITELLTLWQNRRRSSSDVRKIASRHLDQLNQRVLAIESMRQMLEHVVECCESLHRPDCPIPQERETQSVSAVTRKGQTR
ncbi:MAG: MerR family DNA-binding protein [Hydrogenophaga sp.]|uniref:MerR family DNA-binding protein n=1 Tax=Hydrogenophaga sp. TaxID=1904254 RepID=UPI0027355E8B|nr:MerR family DNA-binding protein [Hydrogenophaga sp.]MDP3350284.1 MerR family DNA-binding protein [Hydrogenophaga sp.]